MALSKIRSDSIEDTAIHGRRNLIINGAMQVAQRGTSFNNISSDTFVVDRFFVSHGNVTPNVSQQTVAVGGETGLPVQFTKFARCDFDVNGGSNLGIHTRFEDTEKYVGTHTVSFYAKGTNPTGGQMAVRFIQRFGSGGSSQVITDPSGGLFTLTSNWQRFSVTVTLPSVSGKTLGSGRYLQLQITQPNADSGTGTFLLDITGVQLEVGETATPFEHRSYGEEQMLCDRYFQKIFDPPMRGVFSGATNGGASRLSIFHRNKMRATPTLSTFGTFSFWEGSGTATGSALNGIFSARDGADMDIDINTAKTAGKACCAYTTNSTSRGVNFDAEL